jgi:hypothetical protein
MELFIPVENKRLAYLGQHDINVTDIISTFYYFLTYWWLIVFFYISLSLIIFSFIQGLKLRKYFRGQVGPYQIILVAHTIC